MVVLGGFPKKADLGYQGIDAIIRASSRLWVCGIAFAGIELIANPYDQCLSSARVAITRHSKMASRSTWQTSLVVSAGIDSSGQSVKVIQAASQL